MIKVKHHLSSQAIQLNRLRNYFQVEYHYVINDDIFSAGKEADKAKVDTFLIYKFQITAKIHNGIEKTSEFYVSITVLLGAKESL